MNPKSDVYELPDDIVAPNDDGAADHLLGLAVPRMCLPSTMAPEVDLAQAATGTLVIYVYPMTGTPGKSPPEGWDGIPGARGCTPENCAFRDHYGELTELGTSVLGVSAQSFEEQRDFARRERLPYPLLNDSPLRLAQALGLPTFEAASMRLYKRLTLVAQGQKIVKVFYPIFPPGSHPGEVIAWLQQHANGAR